MKYLLTILLFPLFTYSQSSKDTLKIPIPVAKQITKDLVSGDSAIAELKLATYQLSLFERKVTLKDSVINVLNYKNGIYEQQIFNEKEKFKVQEDWIKDLQKENKKLKVHLYFTRLALTAVALGLTYAYITK